MDFKHTEERQMLADTLEKFVANETSMQQRLEHSDQAGFDPALWAQLADLGVLGALFDESIGGFGGQGFDTMVVCQALGRGLVSSPVLESTLMAGSIMAAIGDTTTVEQMIAGTALPILAHFEPNGDLSAEGVETTASPQGADWGLAGTKSVVKFGSSASLFLVSAKLPTGEVAVFAVDPKAPGLNNLSFATIDGGQGVELILADTPATLICASADQVIQNAMFAGMTGLCAEALGIMEVMVDMTREYLGTRKQFGLTLSKFQALQHRFVEVMVSLETAKSAAIMAANAQPAARQGDSNAIKSLHAAKYSICETGNHIAREAVQMHGGIAMTWEYDLNHLAKRLMAIDSELGDEDYHLDQFMQLS